MSEISILDKAIIFAVDAHKGVNRKGKDVPYIVHPLEAVAIVATMTEDKDLMAAAALHDVLEDTDTDENALRLLFGERITELVKNESEDKADGLHSGESWHVRKEKAIIRLKNASRENKIVALGDKLSNMRAISNDYDKVGERLWERFHITDKKVHSWRYHALADAFSELSEENAYKEFVYLVNKVFGDKD